MGNHITGHVDDLDLVVVHAHHVAHHIADWCRRWRSSIIATNWVSRPAQLPCFTIVISECGLQLLRQPYW